MDWTAEEMRRKRQDYINSAMNAAGKKPVPPPQYNKKRHEEAAEAFSKTQKKTNFLKARAGVCSKPQAANGKSEKATAISAALGFIRRQQRKEALEQTNS